MLEFVLNFFYPPKCGFCGKLDKNFLCSKCYINIKKLEKLNKIKQQDKYFNEIIYLFKYDGIIRKKILDYKFNDNAYLYKTLSRLIIKNKKLCGFIKNYDIIIPVPMYKTKKWKRGYNQTELIAQEITTNIDNISINTQDLIKIKNTKSQSLLNRMERQRNAIGVYSIKEKNNIIGKNILLFDDIYTTGSTVDECSKILKTAGASNIGVLVLAKD